MIDLINTKSLDLLARQVVEGFITGLHKSPYQGFSVEFAEHRLYNKGESTKNIDWKLYGRTDKLYVKRYEEETNLRCQLVLDVSSSMNYPKSKSSLSKLKYSVVCMASIAELLRRQRDAIGLTTFNESVERHIRPKSSKAHLSFIQEELESVLKTEESLAGTSTAEVIHEVAEMIKQRSLVVLFTDFFDYNDEQGFRSKELFDAVQHLRHKKHEVIVFHVSQVATERDFDFKDKWLKMVDLESGEEMKLDVNTFKKDYSEYMNKYYKEIEVELGNQKVDFIQVDVDKNPDQVLLPFLLKRSKMF